MSGHLLAASVALVAQLGPHMPSSLAPIVERALPAVVNISSTRVVRYQESPFSSDPFFRHFFGDRFGRRIPRERREQSLGSGVIVSPDGFVVTNSHVLQSGDAEIRVYWEDQAFDARIVGRDTKTDIALLEIDAPGPLPHLPFGDSETLRTGDFVLAIGNPFGLDRTVTMGIVSAVGRADVGIVDYEDFIQTDAAINPGNSGGALLNLEGELVGINTAILSRSGGYQGIGFAVPSRMAESVVGSLIEHGEVRRGWIGVSIQDLTPELSRAMGLDGARGVLVSDVFDRSPADRAGIRAGDVIVAIDGRSVTSAGEYRLRTSRVLPGMRSSFTVVRDSRRQEIAVGVDEVPERGDVARFEAFESSPIPGVALAPMDDETASRFGLPPGFDGIVVTEIREDSDAMRAGLRRGDVILSLDRVRVRSVEDLEKLVKRGRSADMLLLVQRGPSRYWVAVPRPR